MDDASCGDGDEISHNELDTDVDCDVGSIVMDDASCGDGDEIRNNRLDTDDIDIVVRLIDISRNTGVGSTSDVTSIDGLVFNANDEPGVDIMLSRVVEITLDSLELDSIDMAEDSMLGVMLEVECNIICDRLWLVFEVSDELCSVVMGDRS